MRTKTLLSLLLAIGLLAGSSAAAPKPTPTITQPTPGQVISRGAGTFTVAGNSGFVTPTPTDTPLYLRYEAAGASNCGIRYLSATNGPDAGNSCQSQTAALTLAGQTFTRDWVTDERANLPITVDAGRNLTGTFTVRSTNGGVVGNWVQMDVTVRINDVVVSQSFDTGFYQGATSTLQLNMDLPDTLDKVDATEVAVTVNWRRVIHAPTAYHTYIELDNPASFISVPSYAASFSRKVLVAVDDSAFSFPQEADLDLGAGTFTTQMSSAGLSNGTHVVHVRAVQGTTNSATKSVSFTVTA